MVNVMVFTACFKELLVRHAGHVLPAVLLQVPNAPQPVLCWPHWPPPGLTDQQESALPVHCKFHQPHHTHCMPVFAS
jgi:hypothetical protein